jgi:hypothetical protein
MLPVAYVQQILENPVFHTGILLRSLEEIFSVLDSSQVKVLDRLISKSSPENCLYNIFGGRGVVRSTKSISVKVPVSLKDGLFGHKKSYESSLLAKDEVIAVAKLQGPDLKGGIMEA